MLGPYQVIVTGGLDFEDYELLASKLDAYLLTRHNSQGVIIVSGGEPGTETLTEHYAKERNIPLQRPPYEPDFHGDRALFVRTEFMTNVSRALVAFWDGRSPDTHYLIQAARSKGLAVKGVRY
ncbi:DUF2493 domain-containing protein [Ferrimonas sediminicola]|uniref:DUF2493 domain-containing protein n=1 Tax=Ferrimonas sediminicola TaxID=2569538 RepID=A0A4U1BFF6_9GAMM|nr:DUF2493 domain-containing protein [Ferrimonas sediminicola]TKB49958.1 DUF2493 domain-containing protein [Ferrimonas sediminicola]